MSSRYFAVELKSIVVDSVPDFDLFIKQNEKFILYRQANVPFKNNNLQTLMDNKVESLFVSSSDQQRYNSYRARVADEIKGERQNVGYSGVFVDEKEVEKYHKIIDDYHSVDCRLFQQGIELDFPLFNHRDNDIVLLKDFAKEEGPWEIQQDIACEPFEVMIRKSDGDKYRSFIENMMNMPYPGADERQQVQRKATALREMNKIVIQDILDDPRSGEKMKEVDNSVKGTIDFILDNDTSYYSLLTISEHDFYTYTHSLNVCTLAVGLGTAIGLPKSPDLEMLGLGAMIHDVGKSQVDSTIINKPGRLTEEEFASMKNHVTLGVNLLKQHHNLHPRVLEPVAQHHEKVSGNGYPLGIKGSQLTLFGRISSIVDIYDALTTKRSYKNAFTPFEALSFLSKTENDYDNDLLKAFVMMLGKQIRQG